MLRIFQLSLLIIFVLGEIKFNCTVAGNTLFHWKELENQRVYFQVSTPSKFGWSSIGFSNNNTIENAFIILYYQRNNTAYSIQLKNHTYPDTNQIYSDLTNDFEFPNQLLGDYFDTFAFTLPKENLISLNYIFTAYTIFLKPQNLSVIPKHNRARVFQFSLIRNLFFD